MNKHRGNCTPNRLQSSTTEITTINFMEDSCLSDIKHIESESPVGYDKQNSIISNLRFAGQQSGRQHSLIDATRRIIIKRERYVFQILKQFILFSDQQSSIEVEYQEAPATPEDTLCTLRTAIDEYIQKLKVYSFIRIKSYAQHQSQLAHQSRISAISREYLFFRVQTLQNTIQNAFKSSRIRALKEFFAEIEKFSQEHGKREEHITQEGSSGTLRKLTNMMTYTNVTSPSTPKSRQVIYILNRGSGSKRSESGSNSKQTYIKVPLYADSIEVNQINIRPKNDRPMNISTMLKRKRRALNQVSMNGHHGKEQCNFCKFCHQQRLLREIERQSLERKNSLSKRPHSVRENSKNRLL